MSRDSRIAFEVRDKWAGAWNSSPALTQELGVSNLCAELIHRYVSEQGVSIENENAPFIKVFALDKIAERDDIDSLDYGTSESKEEARRYIITMIAYHYLSFGKCANEMRVVAYTENHN